MAYYDVALDNSLGDCSCGGRCGPAKERIGEVGWAVKTPVSKEGHEVLTRRAIGARRTISFRVGRTPQSVTLTPAQITTINAGNRSVDLGWMGTGVLFSLNPGEQKRHALRRTYGQSQAAALSDIINEMRRQHGGILSEGNPREQLRKIGKAIHLVQDSYSPAHCERDPRRGCITYIRNFGRGRAPREHAKPKDSRDEVARSVAEAGRAVTASREYLQIVFKAIWGKRHRNRTAVTEAAREFNAFVGRHLRRC